MDNATIFLGANQPGFFSSVNWAEVIVNLIVSVALAVFAAIVAYRAGRRTGKQTVDYQMQRSLLFADLPHLSAIFGALTHEQMRDQVEQRYNVRDEREEQRKKNPRELSIWENHNRWDGWYVSERFWTRELIKHLDSLIAPESIKVAKDIRAFKTTAFSDLSMYDSIVNEITEILARERGDIDQRD